MTGFDAVLSQLRGLHEAELQAWIAEGWVRPEHQAGRLVFQEIDIARCRLILELREELEVNEAAMPVVLRLLDQLHATRRQLRRLAEALDASRSTPDER